MRVAQHAHLQYPNYGRAKKLCNFPDSLKHYPVTPALLYHLCIVSHSVLSVYSLVHAQQELEIDVVPSVNEDTVFLFVFFFFSVMILNKLLIGL